MRKRDIEKLERISLYKSIKSAKEKSKPHQEVFGDWLNGFEWNYWTTLTTPHEMTLKSARLYAQKFSKKVKELDKFSTFFWAAEPHDVKDGNHIHMLIKANDFVDYKYMFDSWQIASGAAYRKPINEIYNTKEYTRSEPLKARCHFERYNKKIGAGAYCAKYISKNLSDYDLIL